MLEFPPELNIFTDRPFLSLLSKEARKGCLVLDKYIRKLRDKFEEQAKRINKNFYEEVFEKHMSTVDPAIRDAENERFIKVCKTQFDEMYKKLLKDVEKSCDDLIKGGLLSEDVRNTVATAKNKAIKTEDMLWYKIETQIKKAKQPKNK